MNTKTTFDGVLSAPETEMEEVAISMEHAKKCIALRDALTRLSKNQDFKAIILDGYMKDEALRLTQISAEVVNLQYRDEIFDAIKGISHFRQFCDKIFREGDESAQALLEHEELMTQLEEEDDEGLEV